MSIKEGIIGAMIAGGGGNGGGSVVIPNINATAQQLPFGSEPTVTKSGTPTNINFEFGIPEGEPGQAGTNGEGVPSGGTTGQVLSKATNNNYDTVWVTPPSAGTNNYNDLSNQPQVNGVTLVGDKSTSDLKIIPVLDLGTITGTPPVQVPLTSEQVTQSQLDNSVAQAIYQGITLHLQKIGQSDTQVVFSGFASNSNIFFFVNIANSQGTFNVVAVSGGNYTAGDGIKIDSQIISALISSEPDNATQIYNGAIYTPATFQTTVSPTIVVSTSPATPSIQITATKGVSSVSAETNSEGIAELTVTSFGTWNVSGTVDGELITVQVPVGQIQQYNITLAQTPTIYGATWDGSASPAWSRTDGAELFTDPQPAVNNGTGSSPFDTIMPWAGMTRVSDPIAGEMVQIPKYWYKWTRSGASMQLQIANEQTEGFYVSPAHADRGDGQGERDVVYVGRYHCGSDYKSTTGVQPIGSITRATARTSIHELGAEYWQYDFAMYWTIAMLYLVEFANWNSQAMIGYGCSPSGSKFNMGLTDAMQYHTGTSAASRTTYGCCQYRNIEGLWDNVLDWCDGIYFSGITVYCIKNPMEFSDSSGGTSVGARSEGSNYISGWTNPMIEGFEYALYPSEVNGSETTYVCDYNFYGADGNVLSVGGYNVQQQLRGIFFMAGTLTTPTQDQNTGCRIQKLPNAT